MQKTVSRAAALALTLVLAVCIALPGFALPFGNSDSAPDFVLRFD